jgi:RNA polymerase sigma factor (sigma-70 family)
MTVDPSRGVWKQLDGLFRFGASGQLGDAELLGRYVSGRRDEAAEDAFAALVERHGPMVLGVCRRVLGDRHAAEDAFQATFLVLARKAGAIARRERLANWLHGVASRTALDARARADRRRARERKASAKANASVGPDDGLERLELRAILDEELARLPASYRGPVILCEFDGLSRQVAARRLGIPEGTLSSRLARAKDLLRHRLTRRGLAPSAVAIEVLAREARAVLLPPSLAGSTIQAAARVAAGTSLAEAASASVVTLTQGALDAMLLAKIKGLAFGLAAAAVVTTGVGVLAQPPTPAPSAAAQEDRLGAVEKKLDRILEALGGREGGAGGGVRDFNRWANRAGALPAGGASADGSPMAPAPPGGAPPTGPAPTGMAPPMAPAALPGAHAPMAMPGMPPPMAPAALPGAPPGPMAMPGMPPMNPRSPMDARVAALERRLADLERRFEAMEQRLSTRVGAAYPGQRGRNAALAGQARQQGQNPQAQNAAMVGQGGQPGESPYDPNAATVDQGGQPGQNPQGQNAAARNPGSQQGSAPPSHDAAVGNPGSQQAPNRPSQDGAAGRSNSPPRSNQAGGSADRQYEDPFRNNNPGSGGANSF